MFNRTLAGLPADHLPGSLAAGDHASNLGPRRSGYTRVTGAERDEMAAELTASYARGTSIRALAAEHGRSYGFVRDMLTEAGASLRDRGGLGQQQHQAAAQRAAQQDTTGPRVDTAATEGEVSSR